MIRILRPSGRALIYVWAKNQALKNKSSYLRQNKRNNRSNVADDDNIDADNAVVNDVNDANVHSLPIHTNRTQFKHSDILVPWKLKAGEGTNPTENSNNSDSPKTYLRYYHVFEENELEQLCSSFSNISIVKSYYDQGNWCVIIEKTASVAS